MDEPIYNSPMVPPGSRDTSLDAARVLCILGVIIIHVSGLWKEAADFASPVWQAAVAYEGAVRWCVPMLVLISGALFLSRPIDIKRLYTKNIARVLSAFLIWSVFYTALKYVYLKNNGGAEGYTVYNFLYDTVVGRPPMWFCYMITILYMLAPLLQKAAQDQKLLKYMLWLIFVVVYAIPITLSLLGTAGLNCDAAWYMVNRLDAINALGFGFYFLLGSKLYAKPPSKKCVWPCVAAIAGCAAVMFIGTLWLSNKYGGFNGLFYGNTTPLVALMSCAAFVLARYAFGRAAIGAKAAKFLACMSRWSYGAFLSHVFWIERLNAFFKAAVTAPAAPLMIIAGSLIVFALSYATSALISKIPVVGKYAV